MTALSGRDFVESEEWLLRKLNEKEYYNLKWFDCDDDEINEFFYDIKKLEHKLKVAERAFELMFAVVDCPVAEAGKCEKPDEFNCIEYYKHLAEKELEESDV